MKTTNTPKERPILFSGPMVRAILDGRKTQTRRIVKPKPHSESKITMCEIGDKFYGNPIAGRWCAYVSDGQVIPCPYGQPGNRLWVKETFTVGEGVIYRAEWSETTNVSLDGLWKPSIFMPRKLSRITLEITAVRVERLQDITEQDAIAEGLEILPGYDKPTYQLYGKGNEDNCSSNARKAYSFLWESINGPESWAENPWVWVVEFQRI